MSEVTDLLDRMTAGTTTVEDVARDFESRSWPTPPEVSREDALQGADPEPDPDGSFAEVAAYYDQGKIDDEQYTTLAKAAAKGMGAAGADALPDEGAADGAPDAADAPDGTAPAASARPATPAARTPQAPAPAVAADR